MPVKAITALVLSFVFLAACTRDPNAQSIQQPVILTPDPPPAATTALIDATFTPAPLPIGFDGVIARFSHDREFMEDIATNIADHHPNLSPDAQATLVPTTAAMYARIIVAGEIVKREMWIGDIEEYRVMGSASETSIGFDVYYDTDNRHRQLVDERIPYLVCALRDAGFTEALISIRLHVTREGGQGYYADALFCITPETVNRVNCSNPSQTYTSRLITGGACVGN